MKKFLGQKPGQMMKNLLESHLLKYDEIPIIHHYTDREDGKLQLEVEFRNRSKKTCKFQRIVI